MKKKHHMAAAAIVALFFVSGSKPGSAREVFPGSSQQTILFVELEKLDCDQLWHARNEIYARNGFRFISPRGVRAFGSSGWTKIPKLNKIEKINVERIRNLERARSC